MPIIRNTGGTSDDSQQPFSDQESLSVLNDVRSNRSIKESSSSSRPDEATTEGLDNLNPEVGEFVFDTTEGINKYWTGAEWISILSEEEIQNSVKEDIQGYYAVISNYYSSDAAVRASNPVVELLEDTWTKLEITPLLELDETPDAQKQIGIFDSTTNTFSLAGLDAGSNMVMRTLIRLRPDTDEGAASLRLSFAPNAGSPFAIESQLFNMTQGADVDYQDESIITAFAGSNLAGATKELAGSFTVEVKSTVDTDLEVLAFTLYINK